MDRSEIFRQQPEENPIEREVDVVAVEQIIGDPSLPTGEAVDRLAEYHAAEMNAAEMMQELREGEISQERYRKYIESVYPLVVGFNGGLIRSLSKIGLSEYPSLASLVEQVRSHDHITESKAIQALAAEMRDEVRRIVRDQGMTETLGLVRAVAGQLKEEQEHNDYYRRMLDEHGVDHVAMHSNFEGYLASFELSERQHMARKVHEAIQNGEEPDAFPDAPFLQSVLAMREFLFAAATDERVSFLVYNAYQTAIEFTLVKVVSGSVYPGALKNRQVSLVPKDYDPTEAVDEEDVPDVIKWWDAHAEEGIEGAEEARHIKQGKARMDEHIKDPRERTISLQGTDQILRLFSHTARES